MPIVGPGESDFIQRLKKDHPLQVLTDEELKSRQTRTLEIGILNIMPDKVVKRTEEQFVLPLMQAAIGALRIRPHFFSISGVDRAGKAKAYVDSEYKSFAQIQDHGLDGLIITGANCKGSNLKNQSFWDPLNEVIEWADQNVASTIYSCLATHAYMLSQHGMKREEQPNKIWGVYEHDVLDPLHPLTADMDSMVFIPHSRWNDISEDQFRDAGMNVLITAPEAGVFMAASPDGLKHVLFQGHPEYEAISLMKEWKRDIGAHIENPAKSVIPPLPHHYFRAGAGVDLAREFARRAVDEGTGIQPEQERILQGHIPLTWRNASRTLMANWLSAVFDKTHYDLHKQFMEPVDPEHVFKPLALV